MTAFFRGRLWLWEFSALAWLVLLPYILTAHGQLDLAGHALGRDFVNDWTAGQLVREGHALTVFNPEAFLAAERRLFDPRLPFHFWSYPPPALLLVAPLGWLPYIPALIAWSAAGLALLVPTVRAWFGKAPAWWLLAVLSPAAAVNIGIGQNGAITAAILIGGLALWRTRPIAAGLLLGLLVFKPQIAILLPLAVIAERRWPTMWAAAGSAAALCLVSTLIFGLDAWKGFLGPTLQMQGAMLGQASGPFQWLMSSTFMAARALGAPALVATALQAPLTLAAAWLTWKGWRSKADLEAKGALLMAATFMATPQAFNYDLIPVAVAALVLWRRDEDAVSRALVLAAWALPALMVAAQAFRIPVAPVVLAGLSWKLYRLCVNPSRSASASTPGEVASNT